MDPRSLWGVQCGSMTDAIDPTNPVVVLCAQGMAVEGTPGAARPLFEQAWAARRDDYDAAIAAHYLARHQPNEEATLHWNELAARHAERVADGRAATFLPSLYLNLGDSHARLGHDALALDAVRLAREHLDRLPDDGYRDLLRMGIDRLAERVGRSSDDGSNA
jgi:hypothetical protein